MKKKAIFLNQTVNGEGRDNVQYVFAQGRIEKVAEITDLYPTMLTMEDLKDHADAIKDTEVIFSTWGMPALTDEARALLPNLKAVFYAAGSPNLFSQPLLDNNITLTSSWQANAIPVAEYCLAQILLAAKGFFKNSLDCQSPEIMHAHTAYTGHGVYGAKVALIGNGAISQKLQELLAPFNLEIIVIPSRKEKRTMSLEEAFETCYIVSNHLPNREDNIKDLHGDLFKLMPEGATFINTGRGAQVDEDGLIEVFSKRDDLTALLDVQHPEPPAKDSKLYTLPNVILNSHIAGSLNDEVIRMADYAIEEFLRWEKGEELLYEVTKDMQFA